MVLTHLRDTLALVVVVGVLAALLLGACGGEDAPEDVAVATATPSETATSERASPSPEPEATQAVATATPSETAASERASPSPEPEATQAVATATPSETATSERASPSPEPEATQAAATATPSETAASERASPSPEPEATQAAATTPTPAPSATPETTVESGEASGVLPVDPDVQACSNGVVVPEPELNPGLVDDCTVLLKARDILAGDGEPREFSADRPGAVEAEMFYGEDESPNWGADLPITSWRAVTVEEGRVTELSWPHPGLRGRIPGVLGSLSHLQFLWLSSELTGEIPPELGQLGNLRELWLDSNELTGAIPPELGQLSNLEELRLGYNQLTGSIPTELGQLGSLEYLWLARNQLTGDIPRELGMLSSLQSLTLAENRLSGQIPPEIGSLRRLRDLELRDNQLTGEIPPELSTLSSLHTLDLRNNQLAGSIPPELAELRNLSYASVFLRGNELTGCIPLALGRALRDRHELGLHYCQCPAEWDRGYTSEPTLTHGADGIAFMPHGTTEKAGTYRITFALVLDLPEGGYFSLGYKTRNDAEQIIVPIKEEKSHSSLVLDPFTGEERGRSVLEGPPGCDTTIAGLFDQIVASAREKTLEIPAQPNGLQTMYRFQPVEGGRSYYLGYSDYLVVDVPVGMRLTLEDSSFVCAHPGGCFPVLDLRDEQSGSAISLNGNSGRVFSRTVVEDETGRDIDALFDDVIASLRRVPPPHEGASCETPPTTDDCAALIEARDTLAGDGTLNWSLDLSIWRWDGVTVNPWTGRVVELDLLRHGLSGQIPASLVRLTGLEVLNLYGNALTGGIPAEVGLLTNLWELDLGENPLGGEIPPELGELTNLRKLNLYTTELRGEIPAELGELSLLEELNVYGNYLEGCIPESLRGFDFIIHGSSNPNLRWCGGR